MRIHCPHWFARLVKSKGFFWLSHFGENPLTSFSLLPIIPIHTSKEHHLIFVRRLKSQQIGGRTFLSLPPPFNHQQPKAASTALEFWRSELLQSSWPCPNLTSSLPHPTPVLYCHLVSNNSCCHSQSSQCVKIKREYFFFWSIQSCCLHSFFDYVWIPLASMELQEA